MIPFIPEMRLFHNRENCIAWCEKHLSEVPEIKDDAHAQACIVDGIGIVLIEAETDDVMLEYGLLCHEAYHIVCMNLEELGEEEAGEEIMAYMVQITATALMMCHRKWRKKHKCR